MGKGWARLRGAVARHGAPALAGMVWRTVRKLGVKGALGLARQDRPFLSVDLSGPTAPKPGGWPPVLDARRTLADTSWARWLDARLAAARPRPALTPTTLFLFGPPRPMDAPSGLLGVLLQPGDEPRPELGAALASVPDEVQVVTFDLFRRAGGAVEPLLLPGADPLLLAERDYLFSRAALRAGLFQAEGGVREAILAWCAGRSVAEIRAGWRHLGLPLVEAATIDPAVPAMPPPRAFPRPEPVSVVLCTRDKGHLTRQLCQRLLADEAVGEIVIVSNGTANPYALQTLADLAADPRVTVIQRDEPFNFSRLCNAGAGETRLWGPLLFLNDDLTPVAEDWIAAMSVHLQSPDTGAVGPLLLYPDERVQHAGMVLRRLGGAGHLLRHARLPEDDYLGLAASTREVTAVTGAALMVRRADFEAVGGFDEGLAIGLQDVDLCLKLRALGRRNVFEPRAVLLHMESTSLKGVLATPAIARQRHEDHRLFIARWGEQVAAGDPFLPAGFDPEDETLHRLVKP